MALSDILGIPDSVSTDALRTYSGADRRFEFKGSIGGINIIDDYAHHPTEIETTLTSVKGTKHNHNIAVFQSHTYSRTKDHLKEFGEVLSKFDEIIIAPIYAAREVNTFNISEDDIVKEIMMNGNTHVKYIDSFDKIVDYLKEHVENENLVITIGAGPINEVGRKLVD